MMIEASPEIAAAPTPPSAEAALREQRQFAEALAIANRRVDSAQDPKKSARQAAEDLVAVTLVQPILSTLRQSTQAAPPFAPTSAERQFGALLDAQLAQDIVRAGDFPLVDRLARDLLTHAERLGQLSPQQSKAVDETAGQHP